MNLNLTTRWGETAIAGRPQGPSGATIWVVLEVFLWVFGACAVLSSLAAPTWAFDDAIPLVDGVLVRQGRTPNLDFYSIYPPLGPYVAAALFSLLGRTVIATRLWGGLIYLLLIWLATRLFRAQFGGVRYVPILTALVVAASTAKGIALPSWSGFGLSAVALLAYLMASQPGGRYRWLKIAFSGLLTGLALLFRVNFGAYVAAVVALDLALQWWCAGRPGSKSDCLKSLTLAATAFFVPMLICFFGFCSWAYGTHMGAAIPAFTVNAQRTMVRRGFVDLRFHFALVSTALIFPAGWYCLRTLKLKGRLSWVALAVFAVDFSLIGLAFAWGDHVAILGTLLAVELVSVLCLQLFVQRLPRLEFCLVLFYLFQLHYFLSRADGFHARFLALFPGMLLPFLLVEDVERAETESVSFRNVVVLGALGAVILALLVAPQFRLSGSRVVYGTLLVADVFRHPHTADTDRVVGTEQPKAAWLSVYPDVAELDAVRYIRGVTKSDEPIFVGVRDHSKVFMNDLRIYWLSSRPIGVRTFQLESGIATEAEVQREIIADLKQNHVQWLIIDRRPEAGDETFIRRGYVGSTLLDNYIRVNFQEQAHFDHFLVLRQQNDGLPYRPKLD